MKFLKLHSKTTAVLYKNSICSLACGIVFLSTMASVIIPILLVSFLSPYSGVSEVRSLYEQPKFVFQHKYLAIGESLIDENMIACSNFAYFNSLTENYQKCQWIKYSTRDYNYDGNIDKAIIELSLDTDQQEGFSIKQFYLVLVFKGFLKHKCPLEPPATIVQEIQIPNHILPNGEVILKGFLELTQNYKFFCPYYGRQSKSVFHTDILSENSTRIEYFTIEYIREQIKLNPAYFSYKTNEIYYKKLPKDGLTIKLIIDIVEVSGRYHLSIWERLGQFWLYFASFFGISFYICNKIKDFLFSRHIVASWEIIPWKKLY